jgi:hypothetical protein
MLIFSVCGMRIPNIITAHDIYMTLLIDHWYRRYRGQWGKLKQRLKGFRKMGGGFGLIYLHSPKETASSETSTNKLRHVTALILPSRNHDAILT